MNKITNNDTIWIKPKTVEKKWYVIDAADRILGKVAVDVVKILRGKHKAYYTPHQDLGDNVIIINASKVKLTGKNINKNFIIGIQDILEVFILTLLEHCQRESLVLLLKLLLRVCCQKALWGVIFLEI